MQNADEQRTQLRIQLEKAQAWSNELQNRLNEGRKKIDEFEEKQLDQDSHTREIGKIIKQQSLQRAVSEGCVWIFFSIVFFLLLSGLREACGR